MGAGIGVTSATWPNVCDGLTDRQGRFEWRRECRVTMLPGESIDRNTGKLIVFDGVYSMEGDIAPVNSRRGS